MRRAILPALALAVCAASAEPMRVTLTFDDGVKDHLTIAAPALEKRGWRGTFCITTSFIGGNPCDMTWEDVRELARRGHEIATHTVNHAHMVRLLSAGKTEEAWHELVDSRDAIADRTGFVPRFYCPPFTEQNDATAALARRAGLEQFSVARYNFGSNNADRVESLIDELAAKGCRRVDILSHGVAQDSFGGYCSFQTAREFEAHLDRIAAMEKAGKVVVTDYGGMRSDCALKAKAWPRHGVLVLSFDDGGRNLPTSEKALPVAACDEVFMSAADFLTHPLVCNVIVGANYHTDMEDILCAVARAGARGEALSLVAHDISAEPHGGKRFDWLERILASAKDAGVIVRGVR